MYISAFFIDALGIMPVLCIRQLYIRTEHWEVTKSFVNLSVTKTYIATDIPLTVQKNRVFSVDVTVMQKSQGVRSVPFRVRKVH